jgi:murein DD-endopeptidase MepM/ murein hydrolase activator NlpD
MTRRRTIAAYQLALAAFGGFVGGVVLTGLALQDRVGTLREDRVADAVTDRTAPEAPKAAPPVSDTVEPAVLTPRPSPGLGIDPIGDLRDRDLLVPVQGVAPESLRSSFDERRGSERRHEAMDILAPRHTPVVAVEAGTIARLFSSARGGLTIYQFDPASTYVYYYAHLERYAPGLKEGATVRPGQVVGFVGTSGNAPPDTPHLHFAIFKLTEKKRWWEGTPIDPYLVLR